MTTFNFGKQLESACKKYKINVIVGYWGNATASVDWCEQNYQHSQYIAETYNSITNIFYTIVALYGYNKLAQSSKNPPVPLQIIYFCVLAVSLGSFTFHATLTKFGQLVDELPMLYAILIFNYFLIFVKNKSSKWKLPVASLLTIIGALITYYMISINPDNPQFFFDTWYILCQISLIFEIYWNCKVKSTTIPVKFFTFFHVFLFYAGVFVWTIENKFCHHVEALKLHSMWHLFSALTCSVRLGYLQFLYYDINEYRYEFVCGGLNIFSPFVAHAKEKLENKEN
eukprot:gene6573-10736_t